MTIFKKTGWLLAFLFSGAAGLYLATRALTAQETSWSLLSGAAALFSIVPFSLMRFAGLTARRYAAAAQDPNATLILQQTTVSRIGNVVMFMSLAAACGFGLIDGVDDPVNRLLTWVGFALFLVMPITASVRGPGSPRMTLGPAGLDYSLFKIGPIAWNDIARVELRRVLRSQTIALYLSDEDKYFRRGFKRPGKFFGWTKHMVPSEFLIPAAMFDVSPEWLLQAIQVRLDHFGMADRRSARWQQGVVAR
jgi:hypothetical protein